MQFVDLSPEFGIWYYGYSPSGPLHLPSYCLQLHYIPNQRENVLNTHVWVVSFIILLCHFDMIHLYVTAINC